MSEIAVTVTLDNRDDCPQELAGESLEQMLSKFAAATRIGEPPYRFNVTITEPE